MKRLLVLALFFFVFSLVSSASILDLLSWDSISAESRDEAETNQSTCACNGPSCTCCVDFNMTLIDLGGPGCVHMKYVSQVEGIALNISYGESLIHSKQVKGENPDPTCMPLLTNLAEICARFSDLKPVNDGLKTCIVLEPKILGDVTANFKIGCFNMGPQGMVLDNSTNASLQSMLAPQIEKNGNTTQSASEEINEEDIIAAVNETAEQGLAYFGSLLGFTFGAVEKNTTEVETTSEASSEQPPPSST